FRRQASSRELLWISRAGVIFVCCIGFVIAFFKISTIFELVRYSWSGLGASFGPRLLLSLYRKNLNKYGAFAGILVGGLVAAVWPYFETQLPFPLPSLVIGFILSLIAIEGVSFIMRKRLNLAVEP
ncbi:MAG: sodium/proline symporter, partial [Verrucomicrobiota bacterium]|nr:sodium/proline symporter [Verrucomicrobiota bacterium]